MIDGWLGYDGRFYECFKHENEKCAENIIRGMVWVEEQESMEMGVEDFVLYKGCIKFTSCDGGDIIFPLNNVRLLSKQIMGKDMSKKQLVWIAKNVYRMSEVQRDLISIQLEHEKRLGYTKIVWV